MQTAEVNVVISLNELLTGCVTLLSIAALILLIVLLLRLFPLISAAKEFIKILSPAAGKLAEKLPAITDNVDLIAGNLVDISDDVAENSEAVCKNAAKISDNLAQVTTVTNETVTKVKDACTAVRFRLQEVSSERSSFAKLRRTVTWLAVLLKVIRKFKR